MNAILPTLAPDLVKGLREVVVSDDLQSFELRGRRVEADDYGSLLGPLSSTLYDVLHAGRTSSGDDELPFHLRDAAFEARLAAEVPHRWTRASAVLQGPVSDDGPVVVRRDGVRVAVPRESVEPEEPGGLEDGARVSLVVSPLRPGLSPGFFMVDGSRADRSATKILRVYVSLVSAEYAPAAWSAVLRLLEEREVPYRAKVLSSALLYPRSDAVVVYLPQPDRSVVEALASLADTLAGTGGTTSTFARGLGPGVSCAWEPEDPRASHRGMSFGQHRAHTTAESLIEAAETGENLESVLERRFREANICLEHPYRNDTSPLF